MRDVQGLQRAEDLNQAWLARHAVALLNPCASVQRDYGGYSRETQAQHERSVVIEDFFDVRGNVGDWRDSAVSRPLFMAFQCRQAIGCTKNCCGFRRAVLFDYAHQDMSQLNLACIHPGPGRIPELVAVRAIWITEHIDYSGCAWVAVEYPNRRFETRPVVILHGRSSQILGFMWPDGRRGGGALGMTGKGYAYQAC